MPTAPFSEPLDVPPGDPHPLKYCSVDDEIDGLMLEPGDLLFNRTNSPELVGKSAVYRADVPASFASYLIRGGCPERRGISAAVLDLSMTHEIG